MNPIGSLPSAAVEGTLLPGMEEGIKVRLQGMDGSDVGIAHAPPPVERGDMLALADGSIWRVVNLIDLDNLGSISRVFDVLCMVEPA